MKKRIISMALSALLVFVGLLSRTNMLPVKASAGVYSIESTYDTVMLLYSLLETAMIAGGAIEGFEDYESGKSILEAFDTFAQSSMGGDIGWWAEDIVWNYSDGTVAYMEDGIFYATLSDGSELYLEDNSVYQKDSSGNVALADESLIQQYYSYSIYEDGTGALIIPEEGTFAKYRLIDGGGDSGDSDPEDPFSKVESLVIGSGFTAVVGEFVSKVYKGEIDGINMQDYFFSNLVRNESIALEYCFYNGTYPQNEAGEYIQYGQTCGHPSGSTMYWDIVFDTTSTYPIVGVSDGSSISLKRLSGDSLVACSISTSVDIFDENFQKLNHVSQKVTSLQCDSFYAATFPIFNSVEAALDYLLNGNDSAVINTPIYDFETLIDAVPETMQHITAIELTPGELVRGASSLRTDAFALTDTLAQAQGLSQEAAQSQVNTQTYQQTLNDSLSSSFPASVPEPEPDVLPDTSTELEGEIEYSRDLRMIFPFCIPFDLINLLDALDAEPITPRFEIPFIVPALKYETVVVFDLSFLDSVMEIFRIGELGSFGIALMLVTRKVIKW